MSRRPRTAFALFADWPAASRAHEALKHLGVSERQAVLERAPDGVRLRVSLSRIAEEQGIVRCLLSSEARRVEVHDGEGQSV